MPAYPPFAIEVDDRTVSAELDRLQQRLTHLTPAMEDIARVLANIAEDALQTERDPWGNPWAALSAAYVARPRTPRKQGGFSGRGGDAHPILQVTGGLAASLSHGADAHSAYVGLGKVYSAAATLGYRPQACLADWTAAPWDPWAATLAVALAAPLPAPALAGLVGALGAG